MVTKFITPNWRMPRNSNQSKASNYSLNFDGSSHLNLNDLASTLGSQGSFSAWVNVADWSSRAAILAFAFDSDNFLRLGIRTNNNNCFAIGGQFNNVSNEVLSDATSLSENVWYHVVATSNGSVYNLYVNGQLQTLTVLAGSNNGDWVSDFSSTATRGRIGSLNRNSSTNEDLFNGKIGPVSVFDYALTGSAVTALYNSGIPSNPLAVTTPPIAYYDLGQGSAYASGSAGIVEPNLAAATGSTVFDFGGTSEVINTNTIDLGNTHTISYWCNVSATSFSNIISGTGGSKILFNSPNKIYYYSENFTNSQPIVSTPLNQWNNVLISRDSTTIRFYVNGSLKHTTTGFGGNHFTFNKILGLDVNNQLSNLAIWDSSLDASEVSTLYNNGTPLQSYTDIPQSGSLKAWYKLGLDTSTWGG